MARRMRFPLYWKLILGERASGVAGKVHMLAAKNGRLSEYRISGEDRPTPELVAQALAERKTFYISEDVNAVPLEIPSDVAQRMAIAESRLN